MRRISYFESSFINTINLQFSFADLHNIKWNAMWSIMDISTVKRHVQKTDIKIILVT